VEPLEPLQHRVNFCQRELVEPRGRRARARRAARATRHDEALADPEEPLVVACAGGVASRYQRKKLRLMVSQRLRPTVTERLRLTIFKKEIATGVRGVS